MNSQNIFSILLTSLLLVSCGAVSSNSSSSTSCGSSGIVNAVSISGLSSNQLLIDVSSTSICGGNANIPCVSVTVCVPGTSNCQTVSDILVDTGSYGLRIFSDAMPSFYSSLPAVTDGSGHPIGECAQFGSANDWGEVVSADVILGGEPTVSTSIQVINKAFASPTGACAASAESGVAEAKINGILGVGLFATDCPTTGTTCASSANNGIYFSCNGSTCTGTTLATTKQVRNPVALLPTDNNGVTLNLSSIQPCGANGVSGTLTLGIDTQSNNQSTGFTLYAANSQANFTTIFNGSTYTTSFIDSGSNGIFFPDNGLTACGSWYCPGSTQSLSAASAGNTVNFSVADSNALFASGNAVFNDLAGTLPGEFDWGLPFFLGRKVFVGIYGKSSNLGTGPYWAY